MTSTEKEEIIIEIFGKLSEEAERAKKKKQSKH